MSFKRALPLALMVALALPAAATAQEQITPPRGDNYLAPVFLKEGNPLVKGDELGFTVDTSTYTTQADLFDPAYDENGNPMSNPSGGGGAEPTVCEGYQQPSTYGKTIWTVFHPRGYGTVEITASSGTFDEIIRVIAFPGPDKDATPSLPGSCFDDLAGFQEEASGIVYPGQWYAVQVGGTINRTSASQGGPMQVKVGLGPPPRLDGDAVLSWTSQGGRAKIKSLVVSAPRGARVKVTCSHRGCGKNPRPFTARKTDLLKPISAVGPAAGNGAKLRPKTQVRAAKKYKLLAGRRLKNGTTITIRVYADGFIGKHFSYKVKKGAVSSKTVRCTNPGSSKPRRKCG
jgi:hypothetical protein